MPKLWFPLPAPGKELKGNQVKILNRPAAVSFIKGLCNLLPLRERGDGMTLNLQLILGRLHKTEVSQKTCRVCGLEVFEDKA